MTGPQLCLAVSILAVTSAALAAPAEAATVRRHLHCVTVGGGTTIQILIPVTLPGMASITNNWTTPIPPGASYTLTVAGHAVNFNLSQGIAAGASFGAGHPNITGPGQSCDASYLDTSYQTGPVTPPPPKKPKFNTVIVPKKGVSATP